MASPDTSPCVAKVTITRDGALLTGTLRCLPCPRASSTVVCGPDADQSAKGTAMVIKEVLRACTGAAQRRTGSAKS
ncbi:MAG TPA: hypothetical protein VLF20_05305 [Patescibacteria group bacterium]|nr:hypothetical protein [Patescibacteria group bacterium]